MLTRIFLGFALLFGIASLAIAVYTYIHTWGSLEGDLVIEHIQSSPENPVDEVNVFLISSDIGPILDSLSVYYDKNVLPLEDTVAYFREQVKDFTNRARQEEVIFRLSLARADTTSRIYRENKAHVERVIAEKDSVENIFNEKRSRLIDQQSDYNRVVFTVIDNKMLFKAEVDQYGHFKFKKIQIARFTFPTFFLLDTQLQYDEYFVYAFRIFSGDNDITKIPIEMYFLYALSGEQIRKYTWMEKVSVDEESYIRLDESNTSEIFK